MSRGKPGRSSETRELLLLTAERLFAEHGVEAVSNRQVSEAAGQLNNSAVAYHFGSKEDLVVAMLRRHSEPIERRRTEMLAELSGSPELRDWVDCLVRPPIEHLASLGIPSWYARCIAQVTTHPSFRKLLFDETFTSRSMQQGHEGMFRLIPRLPERVRQERNDMGRLMVVHICAERERALHEGTAPRRSTWESTATGLVDALVGLWLAPVSPRRAPRRAEPTRAARPTPPSRPAKRSS